MKHLKHFIFICLLLSAYAVQSRVMIGEQGFETFTTIVNKGTDDVSENSAGAMTLNGEFLWLGGSTSGNLRAIRFENVIIPDGAVIYDAYIEFYAYGDSSAAGANISMELGSPNTYSGTARSISSRNYSTTKVNWSRSSKLTAKSVLRTPNLNNVIDENIKNGWKSGQNMAFRFEGLNTNKGLTVYAYEGGATYRPKLVVKYCMGSNCTSDISESIVSSSANDGSESSTGEMTLSGAFLWLGGSTSGNLRSICFNNVHIPSTASVVDAYIEFYAYGSSPQGVANIYTELGNASAYSTKAYNMSSRQYSKTKVRWNESSLTSKKLIRTPNLQGIIDENRVKGWSSGQNIAFKFEGLDINEGITVYAYDGGASYRPKLVVKYLNDGKGPVEPTMPITIACIGSSTTYGYGLQYRNVHSYPVQLEKELGDNYSVTNLGVNGASLQKSTATAYWNTTSYAKAKTLNSDIFIILLGANDSKAINWKSNSREQYKQNLKDMVGELKAAAIGKTPKIYIGISGFVDPQALISKETTISGNVIRDEIAPAARGVAAELGLETMDFYNLTYGRNELYFDKVHPDRNGAGVIARYAADIIKNGPPLISVSKSFVSAATDDGSENSVGDMTLDGKYLWLGGSTSGHLRAIRFNNIVLPENATIQNAYIEFYAYGSSPDATTYIYSEIGNPVTYASKAKNMSSRNYSQQRVKWEAPILSGKQLIQTPTLKSIIDENRSKGWKSGQSMAFRFEGLSANKGTTVYAYEGSTIYNTRLVIEYIQDENNLVVVGAETNPQKMTLLRINEICSQGSKDQKEDWIELYNGHDFPLHIKGGIYLSDKAKTKTLFELKNIIIPEKGFYIFVADEQSQNGKNYLPFDLKNSGEAVYLSRSETDVIDQVAFTTIPYNQSYGRITDGNGEFTLFMTPTYEASNASALKKADISFSHERGIYPYGFNLTMTAPQGMTIRYTTDGKYPSTTIGTIYSTPVNIPKSSVIKAIAYDNNRISEVVAHTYVLLNNLTNEVAEAADGTSKTWAYRSTINLDEYAQALASLPIVSLSPGSEINGVYKEASVEYIDSHLYNNSSNFFSNSMARKFGNSTINNFNSSRKFKFNRDANARKAEYPFFDPYPNDAFSQKKFHALELKEGQEGPSNTWAESGYSRFGEKVTMNLQKEMGKYALETRFAHLFYNGKYRGVKTLRTDFKQQNMEEIFGDDSDNYTKISLKISGKNDMVTGVVEPGDGIAAIWDEMQSYATANNLQSFKKLVDVEDLIKFQIMFMFIDCEPEVEIIVQNNAGLDPKFMKAKFNINDTDGAFFAGASTAITGIAATVSYGNANFKHKWTSTDTKYRYGVGKFIKQFGGSKTNAYAGNLEFKTLAKDYVLEAFGPIAGAGAGDAKYPLSIQNVQKKISEAETELDLAYKLDAAWYAAHNHRYANWKKACSRIIAQVPERVNFSLKKWNEYNMAHTLSAASINAKDIMSDNETITLTNPNSGTVLYYMIDGSDPMGDNGVLADSAKLYDASKGITLSVGEYKLVVRPFTNNNWGPKSRKNISIIQSENSTLKSLSDNEEVNGISIYPNPVDHVLHLSASVDKVEIYNINGQLVKSVEKVNNVNVENLSSGAYLVKITTSNSVSTHKIIKK